MHPFSTPRKHRISFCNGLNMWLILGFIIQEKIFLLNIIYFARKDVSYFQISCLGLFNVGFHILTQSMILTKKIQQKPWQLKTWF